MSARIPSAALLRDTFRRMIIQSLRKCEEANSCHYSTRSRLLTNIPWREVGPNVQAVQVDDATILIRGAWQYSIDPRAKGQLPLAKTLISEFAVLLASAVRHGQSVKATFSFPPTISSASGEIVTCSFRGVVFGQGAHCPAETIVVQTTKGSAAA